MVQIITREQWGARYEDGHGSAEVPWSENWLHHSVTIAPDLEPPYDDEAAAMRVLEEIGEKKFGRGISYTAAVMPTGRAYQGHSLHREGAHTKGRNDTARAIVLVGNYDRDQVTDAQVETTAQILVDWWRRGLCSTPYLNGGHRDAPGAATACPGRYGQAAVERINDRAEQLAGAPHDQEDDDMPITREDARLIAEEVWGKPQGALTTPGLPQIADETAGERLDALRRLAVLDKLNGVEVRTLLEQLSAEDIAAAIPETQAKAVVAELLEVLHRAAPPAAAAAMKLVSDPDVDGPALSGVDVDEPAVRDTPEWLPRVGGL